MLGGRRIADYRKMMADEVRMRAYERAIAVRCRGQVVCEIGVGLGPLSLMALKAGARKVYGMELDADTLAVATDVIRASGFDSDRFVPLHGLSTDLRLPERVDVILSETLDSIGIGENTARYMADARERFLKSDGRFLPERLQSFLALAHPQAYLDELDFWNHQMPRQHGIDFQTVAILQRTNQHSFRVRTEELGSAWLPWLDIDFSRPETYPQRPTSLLFESTREGKVSGLATAFEVALTSDIHIRTFPEDPETHWRQGFQPLPQHWLDLSPGDLVYVEIDVTSKDLPRIRCELRVATGPAPDLRRLARARCTLDRAPAAP